jgi:hypothetical protein
LNNAFLEAGQHIFKLKYTGTGEFYFADVFIDEYNANTTPTLRYDFEDPSDLARPAIGEIPLEFWQRGSDNTIGTPDAPAPALADGPTADKKAVYITPELNFKVVNPQVTAGGLLNYAIVVDYKVPELLEWNALFQLLMDNNDWCHLYLNNEKIGKANYTGNLEANTWYRLVLNVEYQGGQVSYKVYINGVLVNDIPGKDVQKVGLKDYFWLFTDNEGQYDFDRYVRASHCLQERWRKPKSTHWEIRLPSRKLKRLPVRFMPKTADCTWKASRHPHRLRFTIL